jgi:hypothetical protein
MKGTIMHDRRDVELTFLKKANEDYPIFWLEMDDSDSPKNLYYRFRYDSKIDRAGTDPIPIKKKPHFARS